MARANIATDTSPMLAAKGIDPPKDFADLKKRYDKAIKARQITVIKTLFSTGNIDDGENAQPLIAAIVNIEAEYNGIMPERLGTPFKPKTNIKITPAATDIRLAMSGMESPQYMRLQGITAKAARRR